MLLLALMIGTTSFALGACDNGDGNSASYSEESSLVESSLSEVSSESFEESSEEESSGGEEVKMPTEGLAYEKIAGKEEYAVVGIGTATDTHIVIPDTYQDLPVTVIGRSAFENNYNVTGVTMSNSIVTIEEAAFKGSASITYIYMGNGVKYIGKEAFAYVDDRAEIHFHDSVEVIGEDAFGTGTAYYDKGDWFFYGDINKYAMIDFATSESTPNLNHYMHVNGEKPQEVIVDRATHISSYAFSNTDTIFKYTIGKSVKRIGESAVSAFIAKMDSEGSMTFEPYDVYYEGTFQDFLQIEFLGYWATGTGVNLYLDNELVENVTFPADIQTIPGGIFSGCTSLKSVQIPEGVTSIGDYAFWSCENMTEIVIPDTVTEIGDYAFLACYGLTKIPTMNGVTVIGEHSFEQCYNIVEGDMPENLISIGESAFELSGITSAILPESVTFIGKAAFYSSSVGEVSVPDGILYVGQDAFANCESLQLAEYDNCTYVGNEGNPYLVLISSNDREREECHIHEDTKMIIKNAFEFCFDLKKLTFGSNLKIIEEKVFPDHFNSYVLDIYYQGNIQDWCEISGLYLLTEMIQTRVALYINNERLSSVVIPEGVTEIQAYTFYNFGSADGFTEVILSDSVTVIGDYAFAYCDNIVSLVIGKGVTYIGEKAFFYGGNLTSIIFNGTVAEWKAIEKENGWNYGVPAMEVVCTDGTVSL